MLPIAMSMTSALPSNPQMLLKSGILPAHQLPIAERSYADGTKPLV